MRLPSQAFVELRDIALSCTACRLAETRNSVVFGSGDPSADLMFVGEAPGKNEDLKGEPFVGAAGRLLDELMAGIGMSRDTVYIANVLKCRPPGNRDPKPDEIDSCKGYLREQIRMIEPRVVMTLGNFATKLLVPTDVGITRMRGQEIPWWLGAKLVPTFHPAAALRGRPQVVEQMRDDFGRAKAVLERSEQILDEDQTPAVQIEMELPS